MAIVSSPQTRGPEDLTSHLEDYLEVIAALQQEDHVARAKDIADRLGVARGTVTSALKSLSEKGLINYQPYSHITLTKAGEELAQRIIHRHKTLTAYLSQVLRIPLEKAEQNACRAEHVLDEGVIERMIQFLEFMDKCPRTNEVWMDSFDKVCWGGDQNAGNCKECIGQCLAKLYEREN